MLSLGARHEGGKGGTQRRQREGRQKGQNGREREGGLFSVNVGSPIDSPRIPVHYRPYRISPVHCVYCKGLTIALARGRLGQLITLLRAKSAEYE